MERMKKCKHCGTEEFEAFTSSEKTRCKVCRQILTRMMRYPDLDWEASEYITIHQSHCDICETEFTPRGKHVDHDHESGMIRGVVCPPCNLFLSRIDKNPKTLDNLCLYLKKN